MDKINRSTATKEQVFEYIRSNVTIQSNGCWNWNKGLSSNGYGSVMFFGCCRNTHRLMGWVKYQFNLYDKTIYVCHTCDNKLCCNPEHLFIGSQKDNISDAVRKNRTVWGEKNNKYKHSTEILKATIQLLIEGRTCIEIAKILSVSRQWVTHIKKRRRRIREL